MQEKDHLFFNRRAWSIHEIDAITGHISIKGDLDLRNYGYPLNNHIRIEGNLFLGTMDKQYEYPVPNLSYVGGRIHICGYSHPLSKELYQNVTPIPDLDTKILNAVISGDGSLDMRRWHSCETAHCRAGWAIHFLGEEGHALEEKHGSEAAGALIYAASRGDGTFPNFYMNTDQAMSDIIKCAVPRKTSTATPQSMMH
jgi:hypothetical protein